MAHVRLTFIGNSRPGIHGLSLFSAPRFPEWGSLLCALSMEPLCHGMRRSLWEGAELGSGHLCWRILYNGLQGCAIPLLALPALAYLATRSRYRSQLFLRLGRIPDLASLRGRSPRFWIHALSVGEVNAAVPLVKALAQRWPHAGIVCSATTATGLQTLRARLGGTAHTITALPFDLWPVVRRVVRRFAPDCFLFVETDIWPNMLWELAAAGVPAVLVNGSISSRSVRRLQKVGPLARAMYDAFSVLAMQSADDRERLLSLGISPEKVFSLGNLKYDLRVPEMGPEACAGMRGRLGMNPIGLLWVAGSTHPGEEDMVLAAHMAVRSKVPDLKLVFAPRDPARGLELLAMARRHGLRAALRTQAPEGGAWGQDGPEVLVLDSLGELLPCYALACLAFVGGSLVPVGGHNLFEPAAYGRPVLFGPETESCNDMAEALLVSGGGMRVEKNTLACIVEALLLDQSARERMGRQARALVSRHGGAVARHMTLVADVLERCGSARG